MSLTLAEATRSVTAARSQLDRAADDFRARVSSYRTSIVTRTKSRRAHSLLAAFADSRREVVRARVESLIALAVKGVFGNDHDFRFEVSNKRGVVSMEPQIGYRSGAEVEWRSIDDVGGGMADVVSFAFRVAILYRYRPMLRPILFADEPFKHVSAEYLPAVAEMLQKLVGVTGLQIVIVSHEPEIAAVGDKVYRVSMRDGCSVAKLEHDSGHVEHLGGEH